jgi:hypothetical protein
VGRRAHRLHRDRRDGAGTGLRRRRARARRGLAPLRITASGGAKTLDDLRALLEGRPSTSTQRDRRTRALRRDDRSRRRDLRLRAARLIAQSRIARTLSRKSARRSAAARSGRVSDSGAESRPVGGRRFRSRSCRRARPSRSRRCARHRRRRSSVTLLPACANGTSVTSTNAMFMQMRPTIGARFPRLSSARPPAERGMPSA